jgi:hypothetical protein
VTFAIVIEPDATNALAKVQTVASAAWIVTWKGLVVGSGEPLQ